MWGYCKLCGLLRIGFSVSVHICGSLEDCSYQRFRARTVVILGRKDKDADPCVIEHALILATCEFM